MWCCSEAVMIGQASVESRGSGFVIRNGNSESRFSRITNHESPITDARGARP